MGQKKVLRHSSEKCRSVVQCGPERYWFTNGGCGPLVPWSTPIHSDPHSFSNFTENLDQGGSEWTRRTRLTITPLGRPGQVFLHFANVCPNYSPLPTF